MGKSTLQTQPITLQLANDTVRKLHRHHKPVPGHKFSIGLYGHSDPEAPSLSGALYHGTWTTA